MLEQLEVVLEIDEQMNEIQIQNCPGMAIDLENRFEIKKTMDSERSLLDRSERKNLYDLL